MSIKIDVWGAYACFSRPDMKTDRVTYDVITPSAARGIIEAIYWHPGLRWVIDKIYVLNPIRTTCIKRNEVESKLSNTKAAAMMYGKGDNINIYTGVDRTQRTSIILENVHYVIEAHFVMTSNASVSDNPGKFQDIITRRLTRGQCYHQPYFGCREFPAYFKLWDQAKIPTISETVDLGYMLMDMDYTQEGNICPMFYRAKMEKGVIDVRNVEVVM